MSSIDLEVKILERFERYVAREVGLSLTGLRIVQTIESRPLSSIDLSIMLQLDSNTIQTEIIKLMSIGYVENFSPTQANAPDIGGYVATSQAIENISPFYCTLADILSNRDKEDEIRQDVTLYSSVLHLVKS